PAKPAAAGITAYPPPYPDEPDFPKPSDLGPPSPDRPCQEYFEYESGLALKLYQSCLQSGKPQEDCLREYLQRLVWILYRTLVCRHNRPPFSDNCAAQQEWLLWNLMLQSPL